MSAFAVETANVQTTQAAQATFDLNKRID